MTIRFQVDGSRCRGLGPEALCRAAPGHLWGRARLVTGPVPTGSLIEIITTKIIQHWRIGRVYRIE